MTSQGQKVEIIRFVLESSPEESQKLARFMAGIRTEAPGQGKAGDEEAAGGGIAYHGIKDFRRNIPVSTEFVMTT